ncbi:hypothetical protein BC939DRAFT_459500 [Gamsiella multidivaricata]|uniref:uncharacterized protein n=1 Tax=Gamsiella multidivaricata TaxID=101098 RepID=UPI00221E5818|nr:uncharacterized protein BC939DRAFT_459500 [Gamsiella multidivaricata]KAI7819690.1 hypothetical protein BC939DRAFT_459500 [Gamsiella multidivaricata]
MLIFLLLLSASLLEPLVGMPQNQQPCTASASVSNTSMDSVTLDPIQYNTRASALNKRDSPGIGPMIYASNRSRRPISKRAAYRTQGSKPRPSEPRSSSRMSLARKRTGRSGRWTVEEDRALVRGVTAYLARFGLEPNPPAHLLADEDIRRNIMMAQDPCVIVDAIKPPTLEVPIDQRQQYRNDSNSYDTSLFDSIVDASKGGEHENETLNEAIPLRTHSVIDRSLLTQMGGTSKRNRKQVLSLSSSVASTVDASVLESMQEYSHDNEKEKRGYYGLSVNAVHGSQQGFLKTHPNYHCEDVLLTGELADGSLCFHSRAPAMPGHHGHSAQYEYNDHNVFHSGDSLNKGMPQLIHESYDGYLMNDGEPWSTTTSSFSVSAPQTCSLPSSPSQVANDQLAVEDLSCLYSNDTCHNAPRAGTGMNAYIPQSNCHSVTPGFRITTPFPLENSWAGAADPSSPVFKSSTFGDLNSVNSSSSNQFYNGINVLDLEKSYFRGAFAQRSIENYTSSNDSSDNAGPRWDNAHLQSSLAHSYDDDHPDVDLESSGLLSPSLPFTTGDRAVLASNPILHTDTYIPSKTARGAYFLAVSRVMAHCPWSLIADSDIPGRTGVQAQARWSEALDPRVKKGPWTAEEDQLLLQGVQQSRKCWIWIADGIPGRTQRQCRTRWVQISTKAERRAAANVATVAAAASRTQP